MKTIGRGLRGENVQGPGINLINHRAMCESVTHSTHGASIGTRCACRCAPAIGSRPPAPRVLRGLGRVARNRTATIARLAPVAQLDRASVYGTEGREFESLRAHCARGQEPWGFLAPLRLRGGTGGCQRATRAPAARLVAHAIMTTCRAPGVRRASAGLRVRGMFLTGGAFADLMGQVRESHGLLDPDFWVDSRADLELGLLRTGDAG